MQQRQLDVIEPLRLPLTALGLALVIIGAFLLIYIGYLVYQVINHPEEIRIVQFLLEQVRLEDRAIYGTTVEAPFEINWSESLRTVLFLFIGVMVIGVLASILRTLMSAGIQLIRLAANVPEEGVRQRSTPQSGNAIDRNP